MDLIKKIEELKNKLNTCIDSCENLTDEEVVRCSQELDRLIVLYQEMQIV